MHMPFRQLALNYVLFVIHPQDNNWHNCVKLQHNEVTLIYTLIMAPIAIQPYNTQIFKLRSNSYKCDPEVESMSTTSNSENYFYPVHHIHCAMTIISVGNSSKIINNYCKNCNNSSSKKYSIVSFKPSYFYLKPLVIPWTDEGSIFSSSVLVLNLWKEYSGMHSFSKSFPKLQSHSIIML